MVDFIKMLSYRKGDGCTYRPEIGQFCLISGPNCDAAAANALMEAITAWGKHPGYQGGESWVKKRADEIMAQWGFDSGEDSN